MTIKTKILKLLLSQNSKYSAEGLEKDQLVKKDNSKKARYFLLTHIVYSRPFIVSPM
jgi:hypothetical protein